MSIELLRSLAWTDYRLTLLLVVGIPLGLLIWSIARKAHPISHLLVIYWRVAVLLGIATYLMMAEIPYSFLVRLVALVLIPISLWFWVDLNEEIDDRQDELKLALTTWRWAITIYCAIAAIGQAALLTLAKCFGSTAALNADVCQAWLLAPWGWKAIVHANTNAGKLGIIALLGLLLYSLYFLYFMAFRLTKQGRSATNL